VLTLFRPLPMFNLGMKAGTPLIKRTLGAGTSGALGGAVGSAGEMYADYVGTGEAPTVEEFKQNLITGAAQGAGMGVGVGALAGGGKSPDLEINNRKADIDNIVQKMSEDSATPPIQDGTVLNNPELSTNKPVGDLPSVEQQVAMLNAPETETIPETRDFTPRESAVPDIDKAAAEALFNQQAATRLGATESFPAIDGIDGEMRSFPRTKAEVPTSTLKLSSEVPNFKAGANEQGVVEPLQGEYDDRAQAPIQVWKRLNGDNEVISGRHRLDLAQRTGKETLPVEIYDEARGFTKEMARILDAELNIRDGQGDVQDYAQYFKFRGNSEEQVAKRGILRDVKARQGFNIATKGAPETYDAFINGQINERQAAAIAEALPGDSVGQREGIKAALRGKPTSQIPNLMKMSKASGLADPTQVEMFQNDQVQLSVDEIVSYAEKKARALGSEIRALTEGGKKPELFAKYGEAIKKPEYLLKKKRELEIEQSRWQNVGDHPDLANQVSDELGISRVFKAEDVIPLEDMTAPPSKPDPDQESLFSAPKTSDVEIKPESDGTTQNTLTKPEAKKSTPKLSSQKGAAFVPDFNLDGITNFFKKYKVGVQKADPIYKYFDDSTLASLRRKTAFQSSIAKKFPEFKPFFNEAIKYMENKNSKAYDAWDTLQDYTSLDTVSKKKVNDVAIAARIKGREFIASDENLIKQGLNADQIKAFRAKEAWANKTLDMLKQEEIEATQRSGKEVDMAGIEAKYQEMKDSHYVPFNRYGKYRLDIKDKDGNIQEVRMSDSKSELRLEALKARQAGMIANVEEMMFPNKQEYFGASPDVLNILEDTDSDVPLVGFKKHFEQSKNIKGFDLDLERSMSEYTASLANYLSTKQFKRASNDLFKQFSQLSQKDQAKYGNMLKYARDYHDFMTTPSKALARTHRLFSDIYLAGHIKTAAVNFTQPMTTTYPMVAKYVKGLKGAQEKIVAKAALKTAEYAKPVRERFIKNNPELAGALSAADKKGIINSGVFNELTGRAYNPSQLKRSFRDWIYVLNDFTEKSNRVNAFITGWEAYPEAIKSYYKKNPTLEVPTQQKFAEDFTRETQFDYSKVDRPEFARAGLGKLAFIFRLWPANYLKLLKNSVLEGQGGTLTRLAGTMGALGGITAIPILGQVLKNMEAAGVDPKKAIRDYIDEAAKEDDSWFNQGLNYIPYVSEMSKKKRAEFVGDIALYGPVTKLTGRSIGGALSISDLAPEIEQGIMPGLTRTLMGIAPDVPQRIGKSIWLNQEMDQPFFQPDFPYVGRAGETLLPEAARNYVVGKRWEKEGVKDAKGGTILSREELSDSDILAKKQGFTPEKIAKAYEKANSIEIIKKEAQDNGNINFKLAKALDEGNTERFNELVKENAENNRKAAESGKFYKIKDIDTDSVYSYMEHRVNKETSDLENLPDKAKLEALKVMQRFKD
jgi:hypothetical protein